MKKYFNFFWINSKYLIIFCVTLGCITAFLPPEGVVFTGMMVFILIIAAVGDYFKYRNLVKAGFIK